MHPALACFRSTFQTSGLTRRFGHPFPEVAGPSCSAFPRSAADWRRSLWASEGCYLLPSPFRMHFYTRFYARA
jgi:hypothetical protein